MDENNRILLIAVILIVGLSLASALAVKPANPGCRDFDRDGYSQKADCGTALDCNDKNPSVYPGAPEYCSDTVDSNCNGNPDDCGTSTSTSLSSTTSTGTTTTAGSTTTTEGTCSETDGGYNIYVKGTLTTSSGYQFTDVCDNNFINEHWCVTSTQNRLTVAECPPGYTCIGQDGACVATGTSTTTISNATSTSTSTSITTTISNTTG